VKKKKGEKGESTRKHPSPSSGVSKGEVERGKKHEPERTNKEIGVRSVLEEYD